MKKYIGLTLYLVGLVLLSYTFFYFSGKNLLNQQKSSLVRESTGQVINQQTDLNSTSSGETTVNNVNTNWSGNTNNMESEIANASSGSDLTGDLEIVPLTGENKLVNTAKDFLSGTILYNNSNFHLVKITPYDDIFDILGYDRGFTYQLKGKDVYLKVLKSVDYESEKNNINQLIQQIGGNIKETNLFGEKQFFINIDAYYGKVVIMVVEYKKNLYLMLMPYSLYKQEKNYFKNVLFAK